MPKSTTTSKPAASAAKKSRPLNYYNLYYALEREYLLQVEFKVLPASTKVTTANFNDYADLPLIRFPPLPERYAGLLIPDDWFLPKSFKKRRSKKSPAGPVNMVEMSQTIGLNWNVASAEIKAYVEDVASIIKARRDKLIYVAEPMDTRGFLQPNQGQAFPRNSGMFVTANDEDAQAPNSWTNSHNVGCATRVLGSGIPPVFDQGYAYCDSLEGINDGNLKQEESKPEQVGVQDELVGNMPGEFGPGFNHQDMLNDEHAPGKQDWQRMFENLAKI
ncbi:hypothetical protein ACHAXN_004753 [Cyclotella atomus]